MRKARLIILLVVLLIIGGGAIWLFNMPQRIGLVKSPTERLLSATPDREAAAAIMAGLKASGVNTKGMGLYVLPMKGSDGSVAVAVLDASAGFDFRSFGNERAIAQYLTPIAKSGNNPQANIQRVAVVYKDAEGDSLLAVTAPSETILKFAASTIRREQFLRDLEGKVNLAEVIKRVREGRK